jgi:hypothetical protein
MTLIFVDTETTSLRPDRRVWEVALIIRYDTGTEAERHWFIDASDLDLGNADLSSLKVGRFHERHPQFGEARGSVHSEHAVLTELEPLMRGATVVGAIPWFDTDVLGQRMREHGVCPAWYYHLVDVETFAAGALRQPPPWSFDQLLATFGLSYNESERHTARGDACMVRDLYDAVMASRDTRAAQQ